jgi:5-(carboxyamino)imidazole ribonucleotide synthase
MKILKPGSTIGMLGGGQLGRMAALAAARLGYRIHVYTPEIDSPAAEVSAATTVAAWDNQIALRAFADSVDAITLEFENVPVEAVTFLATVKPVFPGAAVLAVAQDRAAEKTFLASIDVPTGPWAAVHDLETLAVAALQIGAPAVMKTARLGYDGKGQVRIVTPADAEAAWASLGRVPVVIETLLDLATEFSIVLARGQDGAIAAYPAAQNRHETGILAETIVPAVLPDGVAEQGERLARHIAEALNYVGVLAVEFFLDRDGRLLANEIAPRPHNSGHWTIDACYVSQFEQQIRATAGLPLGTTARHSDAVMTNLIGDAALDWQTYVADPAAHLHLYGKKDIRPGRKMGHVTRLVPLRSPAINDPADR